MRVCMCAWVHAEGKKNKKRGGKFRFFKPMNPIIRPLTAHFFVQNTFSLMKCPKSRVRSKKKMLSTKECCKTQVIGGLNHLQSQKIVGVTKQSLNLNWRPRKNFAYYTVIITLVSYSNHSAMWLTCFKLHPTFSTGREKHDTHNTEKFKQSVAKLKLL